MDKESISDAFRDTFQHLDKEDYMKVKKELETRFGLYKLSYFNIDGYYYRIVIYNVIVVHMNEKDLIHYFKNLSVRLKQTTTTEISPTNHIIKEGYVYKPFSQIWLKDMDKKLYDET